VETYLIILLLVAILVALVALGWWGPRGSRNFAKELAELAARNSELDRQLAVERVHSERVPELESQIARLSARVEQQQTEKALLQSELATKTATIQSSQAEILDLRNQINKNTLRIDEIQRTKAELEVEYAKTNETLQQERKQSEERLALLRDARDEMTKEFKLLASAVMQEHGETFSKQNKDQINTVLGPLREKLAEFQVGLATAHTESLKERATLAEQIKQLSATSATMTSETSNLTRAL